MADEVLAQTVNRPLSSPLPTTPTQSLKALQGAAEQETAAIKEVGAAEARKVKEEPMIKAKLAEAQSGYVKEQQTKQQQDVADAEQSMANFKVSADSIGGFATLGSLIGALGMLAGKTGGKQSALGAIQSMTGMMQGYSKGRADEFKRSQIEFDKQFKIMQSKIEKADKQFQQALALMPYNTIEAQKVADSAIAELNSDVVTAKYKQQGLVPTKELLGQAFKASEDAANRANQLAIAQMRTPKDAAGIRKQLPKEVVQANDLRTTLIPKLKEALPIIDRLQKEGKWEEFTVSLGLEPRLAELNFKDDPEAIKLIRTVSLFRSKEFETGGKNLTKMENKILAPLYTADFRAYEGYRSAVADGILEMEKSQRGYENAYPALKLLNEAESEKPAPVISSKQQYDALPSDTEYYEIDEQGNRTKFRKP
jgi:hypothetical protein